MTAYVRSRWVQVGVVLLVAGTGPLLFIVLAAAVGLWPDPRPNPIGPGLLCFVTFWPAVLCVVIGVVRVRRQQRGLTGRATTQSRLKLRGNQAVGRTEGVICPAG